MKRSSKIVQIQVLVVTTMVAIVALLLGEVLEALNKSPSDLASLPPFSLIIGILTVSSVPILLLSTKVTKVTKWISFTVVSLLALFHGLHVVEHLAVGGLRTSILIFVVMFMPALRATFLLWQQQEGPELSS